MKNKRSLFLFAGMMGAAWLIFWLASVHLSGPAPAPRAPHSAERRLPSAPAASQKDRPRPEADPSQQDTIVTVKAQLAGRMQQPHARPGEATLHFKDAPACRDFLARAAQKGIHVKGRIDALNSVRVGAEDLEGLARDFVEHSDDYGEVAANYLLGPPPTAPAAEARAARTEVPLGNHLLAFLGATGDTATWGRGVTVAVIDSGIQSDPTFGTGRVQSLDLGFGTAPGSDKESGHGTGVAALVAGAAPDAPGVAPAANLLGLRVTDSNGQSDLFAVSQAMVTAVDHGAQVINVSLGGYGTSDTLRAAIGYVEAHGAVVVAAAGNDQAAQLMWPAADPRVISVGAVDAVEQQVIFSNSGPQLQITAPGYGVQTAWTNGDRVLMDGTSASAPIISGAIAALMSASPGMNAPDAWKLLQQYTSDGGPAGPDPDYGHGVINLGWAMARNDPSRIDTAISSHYYDAATGTMDIVVQNRSGQAVSGLGLDVAVDGVAHSYSLSWLSPGAVQVVQIPVTAAQIAQGTINFVTQLNNPSNLVDQVPANNRKVSSLRIGTSPRQ